MGLSFSVISHIQRPVHRTWHMEIVNKILHSRVKAMSHHGEASVKCGRELFDFCPIITPLDYNFKKIKILMFFVNFSLNEIQNCCGQKKKIKDGIFSFQFKKDYFCQTLTDNARYKNVYISSPQFDLNLEIIP